MTRNSLFCFSAILATVIKISFSNIRLRGRRKQQLTTYESATVNISQYFDPIRNKDIAISEFRETQQESSEILNEFYQRLKTKAVVCGFCKEDDKIKTQDHN